MAVEVPRQPPRVPPPSEEIHLPGPTYQPLAVAIGATIAIVGVVLSYYFLAVGLLITFVAIMKWVRGAREEFASLPLEH